MSADPQSSGAPADLAAVASAWLARRDRGFTPAEQDAYLEWLRADPRHARAIAHLEKTWSALDALAEWRPAHSAQPNPDLLAQSQRRARGWGRVARFVLAAGALAAAAAVGIAIFTDGRHPERPSPQSLSAAVRVIP